MAAENRQARINAPEAIGGDSQQQETALKKAETLRLSIMDNMEMPAIVGTTYYVSNSGNGSNNGKSPDRVWATLKKVTEANR